MSRVLHYLGSPKNIAGCALALAGLGLHLWGPLGTLWVVVVPALYAIGALVAPASRPVVVEVERFDPDRVRRSLDGTVDMARGRLSPEVMAKVLAIRQKIVDLLPHAGNLTGGAQDLYVLQRTARDYLPTTIGAYLALPAAYATTRVVQDGKTPLQVLEEQLDLLDAQMTEIGEAVYRRDSDRLLAQGRFLEERFGRLQNELKLPPKDPGGQ